MLDGSLALLTLRCGPTCTRRHSQKPSPCSLERASLMVAVMMLYLRVNAKLTGYILLYLHLTQYILIHGKHWWSMLPIILQRNISGALLFAHLEWPLDNIIVSVGEGTRDRLAFRKCFENLCMGAAWSIFWVLACSCHFYLYFTVFHFLSKWGCRFVMAKNKQR